MLAKNHFRLAAALVPTAALVPVAFAFTLAATAPHAAGQEEIEDPVMRAFVTVSDNRIDKHPYFSKVAVLKWTRNLPFVFYLEKPGKPDEHYERQVVNSYLPFLQRLLVIFEREYATPLTLARRGAAPGFAIAVLGSKGSYVDYAQAVGVTGLHHSRAHYDSSLQLAVTYLDKFAPGNNGPEERQAVLHEFVHAMQHAYGTTGRMPRAAWFNEGLAEFHSNSTNVAASLETAQTHQEHLMLLAAALQYADARPLFAPLSDLLAPESYADVLERGKARGAQMSLVLPAFYAQSAAFVEFLCRGEGGKHKANFLRFVDAMLRGGEGRAGFEKVFGAGSLPALEASFEAFITAEARRRFEGIVDDGSAAMPAELAGRIGVMPPVEPFDTSEIGWRDDELGARLRAARSCCAAGDYDTAFDLLPATKGETTSGDAGRAARMRARVAAILEMRNTLLETLIREEQRMAPLVDGERRGGKLTAWEGPQLTLVDRDETFHLPLTVLTPLNLAKEFSKQKLILRASWQHAWLCWMAGQTPASATRYLKGTDPESTALRDDVKEPIDGGAGADALALQRILAIVPAKNPGEAYGQLDAMVEAILEHRASPLIRRREKVMHRCVTALAQRAFSLDDPRCLGMHGKIERKDGGRISVRYDGSDPGMAKDFPLHEALTKEYVQGMPKLATQQTRLTPTGKYHELVGAGVFAWPLSLMGPVVLELDYEMVGGGMWGLMMAMRPDGAFARATPGGVIEVFDPKTRLSDSLGTSKVIMIEEVNKLKVEYDGKSTIRCSLNGDSTAEVLRVGSLTRGPPGLSVHSSTPLRIHALRITGAIDKGNAPQLREAFVARILARLQ